MALNARYTSIYSYSFDSNQVYQCIQAIKNRALAAVRCRLLSLLKRLFLNFGEIYDLLVLGHFRLVKGGHVDLG